MQTVASDAPATLDLLRRMPKAELHLHLDGSLRPSTALALARERGLDEGMDEAQMRGRLTAPMPCRDQRELLDAFTLPVGLMQDQEALERVAAELVEDVALDGTRYVEVRWAPSLHEDRGLTLRRGIGAVVRGARHAAAATGVVVRLIAVVLRTHPVEKAHEVALEAVRYLDDGLTGFDCAGREAEAPDPLRFADAYAVARAAGLGITVHAGEWGGPAQVWRALELQPTRVAHGASAAEDPALLEQLMARGVTLDLCPTSNVQAGLYPGVADHPLARIHRSGVRVTLSTDDRTVSGLSLVSEYANVVDEAGLSATELWAIDRHALEVAFLHDDEPVRSALLAEFDEFAAREPLLRAGS